MRSYCYVNELKLRQIMLYSNIAWQSMFSGSLIVLDNIVFLFSCKNLRLLQLLEKLNDIWLSIPSYLILEDGINSQCYFLLILLNFLKSLIEKNYFQAFDRNMSIGFYFICLVAIRSYLRLHVCYASNCSSSFILVVALWFVKLYLWNYFERKHTKENTTENHCNLLLFTNRQITNIYLQGSMT